MPLAPQASLLNTVHSDYGAIPQMGQPPEKSSSPLSFCNVKSLIVATLAICFAVIVTFLLTWQITKAAFGPNAKSRDAVDSQDPKDVVSAQDLRLPASVRPISYELTLKTYLPGYGYKPVGDVNNRNLTFDGQVTILLNISQSVKKISLNSLDLNFTVSKCSVTVGEEVIKISSIEPMPKFEKVFVNLEKSLEANTEATLKLVYDGPLRTDMTGLYQTTYTNDKGEQKMAAVTQLEPVYARRMVPCFDEPDFKANWTVTVIHPKGTVAIANGIENGESSEITDDFVSSSFKTTPKMSTYLLAVFVSEFVYNEQKTKSGVRFRVWSRPEEKNTTKYAVEAGVKCLEYYEKIYNIKFPLEKQDMVALPDFSAGAMENWGLITYRESALLYDPKIYTGAQKRRVAVVIAHELAHQWFGNLVTMKWWNDIWLNEGFATLIEFMGTDEISDGNFKMKEWFTVDALSTALDDDSVASTHPMTFRIDKAEEVSDSFDSITYEKGGSVLSMIRKTLGEKNFMAGVHHYLTKHQYGNAVAEDLFSALNEKLPEEVLGSDGKKLNVSTFADPWTKQLGYPLLTVSKINSTFVKVTQQRFKLLPDAKEQEKYSNPKWKFKWDVPVWYQEGVNKDQKMVWMTPNEPLEIEMPAADKTLVFNADSDGFYRVNYDEELWLNIIQKLKISSEDFTPKTKVRLIEDAFTAASAGLLNYSIPIQLVGYLKNEKEYIPWCAAISAIKEIISYYGTDPEKEPIENFVKGLIAKSPAKKPIGFVADNYQKDEKFNEVSAANLLISTECSMKDIGCIGNMTNLFKDNVIAKCTGAQKTSDCSNTAAPFRASSYCFGVRNGDDETFTKVFDWFKKESNQVEKANLQAALGCSRDVTTLKKLMLESMKAEGSAIRLQDAASLFSAISQNDVAKDFLLNFLITRWDELLVRLAGDRSGFVSVINCLVRGINSQEGLDQLRAFRSNTKSAQTYDFKKMEENIGVKIAWREKHLKTVSKLFEEAGSNI